MKVLFSFWEHEVVLPFGGVQSAWGGLAEVTWDYPLQRLAQAACQLRALRS